MRFTHWRTNPIGPSSARIVAAAAAASFHTQSGPCTSACAAVAMTSTSKIVQPRFCRTLSPVGRYEPARPSGARSSTIAGTPASAPIPAAQPSSALPKIPPTRIASSASGSERAGTRNAPATRTSRLRPRLLHSIPFSRPPSVRSRSGTGVMPQAGALSSIAPPFAGMTRIRFDGCDLSRAVHGTPVLRV